MSLYDNISNPPLTPQQKKLIGGLSAADLALVDKTLLSNVTTDWRKIARIVGTTMGELPTSFRGIPDLYFAYRIVQLVRGGILEYQGDLTKMGRCEVRKAG